MEEPFLKRKGYFMSMKDPVMKNHDEIRKSLIYIASTEKKHKVCEMDINYIRNAVNKIERGDSSGSLDEILPDLKNELIYQQILKQDERKSSI